MFDMLLPSGGRAAGCTNQLKFHSNNVTRKQFHKLGRLSLIWIPILITVMFCLHHTVGFLQSGTKLLFRRRRQEKESCLSQSHEDISNMGNNFAAAATIHRKKSGSFSRRLIKRFSFRSSGKSKGKSAATNGGASSLDN